VAPTPWNGFVLAFSVSVKTTIPATSAHIVQASEQHASKLVAKWCQKRRIVMISLHNQISRHGKLRQWSAMQISWRRIVEYPMIQAAFSQAFCPVLRAIY
jgi:hypothetical protein